VVTDLVVPLGELVGRRQLAVEQQPGDLEVRAVLRELLDRVAAIAQDPWSPSMKVIADLVAAVFTKP
jgi:hypothetical protein